MDKTLRPKISSLIFLFYFKKNLKIFLISRENITQLGYSKIEEMQLKNIIINYK